MKLLRTYFPDRTQGIWLNDDGSQLCCTMELPWHDNHPQISCIPEGSYTFDNYESPKHGQVWMAQNVPNRSNIEIHNANFASQLLGCIGVGNSFGSINLTPAVLNSVNTLNKLRAELPSTFNLTITKGD